MNKNAKIFVAGHRGLIGSAIVRKLEEQGYTNIIKRTRQEMDLRDQLAVWHFFQKEKPEYVFLCAAKVGGIGWNKECPAEFTYDNLQIQNNVIHSASLSGTKKLLFLGSACIYPKITPQPIKEEYLLTGELEETNAGYALAKIVGLKMCQYYKQQYGFNCISLMPANAYGINDNFNIQKCHVIPALIRKFINAKENNHPTVECFGDGTPTREFICSDDMADASVYLMNNYDGSDIINVGTGMDVTIKELAETIKEKIGYTGEIVWDTTKPNGTPLRKLSNDRLKSLGWSAKINLSEGISRTIKWYMDNKETYDRN
jgi:GDP-L-fucose synthase